VTHGPIGEAPELRNYFVAAGLNSIGILTGGGLGRVLAHWIADARHVQREGVLVLHADCGRPFLQVAAGVEVRARPEVDVHRSGDDVVFSDQILILSAGSGGKRKQTKQGEQRESFHQGLLSK
jgi:hypothetical protein